MYQTNFVTIFMGIVTVVRATLPNDNHQSRTNETKLRVLGGEEASPGEFPFIVMLKCGEPPIVSHCGGSIIHPQWILTAAHCLLYSNDCIVLAGLHKSDVVEPYTQIIRVESTYPHRRFYGAAAYDIALLKLEKEVELNDKVHPIALPLVPRSRPKVTEKLTLAGWGAIGAELDSNKFPINKKFPSALQKIDVFPVDFHSCRRKLKNTVLDDVHRHNLCATGKSGCWGDSGGPLFSQDRKLIGVIIQSHPSCSAIDLPDVYVRVSAFNDWIKNHVPLEPNNASSYKPYLAHSLIPLQICSLFGIPHYLLTVKLG